MRTYTQLYYEFINWKNKVNNVNRYYTQTPLLDLLWDNKDRLEYRIPQGEHFFRGRIFNLDDIVSTNKEYINWVDAKESIFQGYDKKDSGAPPRKSASEGRLNGKGISFLYTCKSKRTVIFELRPTKNEKISIAEFSTKSSLVFADLTIFKSNRIENQRFSDLLRLIAEEFQLRITQDIIILLRNIWRGNLWIWALTALSLRVPLTQMEKIMCFLIRRIVKLSIRDCS